jgi:hypothetical protein
MTVLAPIEQKSTDLKMMRPIKVLHRHDGYISFAVRGEDVLWRQVISIRASALDEWFPQFSEQLLRDSQMSINGSYCTANRRTDLPYGRPLHRKDTLRYLCAAYVDLDYYDLGMETYQVVGELARMRAAGLIPQPSIEIDSGHGMWALWMLHDEADTSKAHRGAFDDNPNDHLQLYVKINRELARRLAHLGSDSAPSASTHVRMHGSFRNDTERFVEWTAHGNADRPYSYTLKELAAALGVELRERPKSEHLAIEASNRPKGSRSRAWKCLNQNRLTAVATIIDLRGGGFAEGYRNKGAFYYALALKGNGESREQALPAVIAMGRDCSPQLSSGECERAVREAYKGKKCVRLFYQTLANALDVDQREAEIISQRIAHHFPAASRHGEMVPLTHLSGEDTRETRRAKRQAAIIEIVEESRSSANGYAPSFREMAAKVQARTGAEASYITIRADYAALGIVSAWSRQPSPVSGSFDFLLSPSPPSALVGEREPKTRSPTAPTSILAGET